MTSIMANGSHWAGESPDTIEQLCLALEVHTLDPRFEDYGNFASVENGITYFFGNFYDVSHVFSILSDDPAVVDRLTALIRHNQTTFAYAMAKRERAA